MEKKKYNLKNFQTIPRKKFELKKSKGDYTFDESAPSDSIMSSGAKSMLEKMNERTGKRRMESID